MITSQEQNAWIEKLIALQQSCIVTKKLYNGLQYQEITRPEAYFNIQKAINTAKREILC